MPKQSAAPPPLTLEDIAARLKALRLDKGWSYRELAERIAVVLKRPVSEATVRRVIEREEREFHETTIHPLRQYVEHLIETGTP